MLEAFIETLPHAQGPYIKTKLLIQQMKPTVSQLDETSEDLNTSETSCSFKRK